MSKKFLLVLLGVLAITLFAFFYTLYQGSNFKTVENIISHSPFAPIVGIEYVPPAPSVTLTIYKGKNGNTLVVQWANLPASTTVLDILRSPVTSTSSAWSLWREINLTPDQLAAGSASFSIGNDLLQNYTFSVQAMTGGNGGGGGESTITWTSSSTLPTISNEPPPGQNNGSTPPPSSPPSTPQPTPTSTPTSTPQNNTPSPTSTTSTSTTGSNPPPPNGIPYYTPQANIAGYGQPPSGSFWVQYANQKIEIDWQGLPSSTTKAAVLRSSSQTGPWTAILTQENPAANYSIQLVDNSLSEGYYYELTVSAGSQTLATYGPEYLPPYQQ